MALQLQNKLKLLYHRLCNLMTLNISRKALDNIGVRFRDNREQVGDRELIQDYRFFRSEDLAFGFQSISLALKDKPVAISGRLKRTDTLIRKLRREETMKLTFMADIVGFRILVASPIIQNSVKDALCNLLPVKYVKDYINEPPNSGYQGIHIICQIPKTFPGNNAESNLAYEIQIRTHYQHIWSTTSESMGEQVKEGGGTEDQRIQLATLATKIRAFEKENPDVDQVKIISSTTNPVYVVLNYDKSKGSTISRQNFGQNLARGIEYYKYLEDQFSRNLNNEVVLLVTNEEKRLPISHTRYYSLKGRPNIPLELR